MRKSQKSQVVIQDFSASAIEIFLRFLYSGSVGGSIAALVEVAAIAEKYQVEALSPLCLHLVRKALTPEVACEVFALADGFHVPQMRAEALDLVFANPEEALKERPALQAELLEEILGSGLLCIAEDALKEILRGWGTYDTERLESMINVGTESEQTSDALYALWERYRKAGRKGVFVGSWVAVIREQGEAFSSEDVEGIASNSLRLHPPKRLAAVVSSPCLGPSSGVFLHFRRGHLGRDVLPDLVLRRRRGLAPRLRVEEGGDQRWHFSWPARDRQAL